MVITILTLTRVSLNNSHNDYDTLLYSSWQLLTVTKMDCYDD